MSTIKKKCISINKIKKIGLGEGDNLFVELIDGKDWEVVVNFEMQGGPYGSIEFDNINGTVSFNAYDYGSCS